MRLGKRVAKFCFLGLVLCLLLVSVGLWSAYLYFTDSETISRIIREHAVRYLPRAILDPGRVRPSIRAGELVLHDLKLRQAIDGGMFETLRIAFLHLQVSPRKLIEGEFKPSRIIIGQPTLRLRARNDGTWNLQGLIADPWPGPFIETPPIQIRNGTVELYPRVENGAAADQPSPSNAGALASKEASATLKSLAAARAVIDHSPAILRDVSLNITPEFKGSTLLKFDGAASGDGFERITFTGEVNLNTGIIELGAELSGLVISDSLRRKLPPGARRISQALALNGGVVDLTVRRLRYDPGSPPESRLQFNMLARLRDGVWECPQLPFSVNNLSADVSIEERAITIKDARGTNGNTVIRASGVVALNGTEKGSMNLHVNLEDLELADDRLRKRTPPEFVELWDLFKPHGRVNLDVHVTRESATAPFDWVAKVHCRDVAAVYRHFPYPLEHLTGDLTFEKSTLNVNLNSQNGRPLWISGTIRKPGPDAVVQLDIKAESLPVDEAIKKAIPPDARKVVDEFSASGLVNMRAKVVRTPMRGASARPEGLIRFDADIDLTERCEINWVGLPFPVRDLKGRLEIHPDKWTFKDVTGSNGQAQIRATGRVEKLALPKGPHGEDPLKIDVELSATNLPFSGELRGALPRPWKRIWPTINPAGACDVQAQVHLHPQFPERTEIRITPRPESSVCLKVTRSPQPGVDPGGTIALPMDNVRGLFVFNNGMVTMDHASFDFRGSPVTFSNGTVRLEDSGRFNLNVHDAWVEEIRFDLDLRSKMPPLMAQFALRLDGGGPFRARGDLEIGWSGEEGDLAWCRWKNTKVVFNDNSVRTAIPIEHIQGELDNVTGWSNGLAVEVEGILKLDSVSFMGQQITQLESPFHIQQGHARLDSVRAHFLGGEVLGDDPCSISLDATPRYHVALSLSGARLEEYARTISGRQSYRGNIDARIAIDGSGSDVRSISGRGEAHISQGDLGELPAVLRLASVINSVPTMTIASEDRSRAARKTVFDSADVIFTVSNGHTTFDSIKFTGNAFSLMGRGTLDPQANMDLRLNLLWGRDRFHLPVVSDFARRASSPFFIARVTGTPSNFKLMLEPLPPVGEALRALNRTRTDLMQPE